MTRWAGTAVLVGVGFEMDAEGVPSESEERTEVFANRRSVGLSTWVAARAAGLHADAEIEIRSADYSGQPRAEVDGEEYEVEKARCTGEFTVLTLKRRLPNVQQDDRA